MNAPEAAKLLAVLAAVDRREFDATTAQGWAWALHDVALEHALEAARRAMDTGRYVDVNAIRAQLRAMRPRFEADVRSAKARGIVGDDWPRDKPLTPELEQQLRDAQAAAWAATNDDPDELTDGTAAALGQIGRTPTEATPPPAPRPAGGRWVPRKQHAALDPARVAAARAELDALPHHDRNAQR